MDMTGKTPEIEELEKEIALLPAGNITTKRVRGKEYYYHRITQGGKRTETYIEFDKVDELRTGIEKRKELEGKLKELKSAAVDEPKRRQASHDFKCYVRIGEQLVKMAAPVRKYRHRECYQTLHDFVFGDQQDKVFILYGLRRTGKTTMIRQIILDMTPE